MSNPFNPFVHSHSTTPDAEIITELRQQLDTTSRQLDVTSQRLQFAEMMILALKEQMRLARIAKYGRGSEKLSDQQLELLEFEPGVSNLEVAAESERRLRSAHFWDNTRPASMVLPSPTSSARRAPFASGELNAKRAAST